MSYAELSRLFYPVGRRPLYHTFLLPKKTGGSRVISKPSLAVKNVQLNLLPWLSQHYRPFPHVHAFTKERSICSNAQQHVRRKILLNVDLEEFFPSISFVRVRGLLLKPPFNFASSVATLVAHICCYNNELPQGAPTSPLLSNMICRRMDGQLSNLARRFGARYTRYADDLTFSFPTTWLPRQIGFFDVEGESIVGEDIEGIIRSNGFSVNKKKTRIMKSSGRQVVTGVKVNEFPNVARERIKEARLQLKCWRARGYELAAQHYMETHYKKNRATTVSPCYAEIIFGKINYVGQVKSYGDPVYLRLAKEYNELAALIGFNRKLKCEPVISAYDAAVATSWYVSDAVDLIVGGVAEAEGSAFALEGIGLVTCAHVLDAGATYIDKFEAYSNLGKNSMRFKVVKYCQHRDLAIAKPIFGAKEEVDLHFSALKRSYSEPEVGDVVHLSGHPGGGNPGRSAFVIEAKVVGEYPVSGVQHFAVDREIRGGMSGGAVLDERGMVVGVIRRGAFDGYARNEFIPLSELEKFLRER